MVYMVYHMVWYIHISIYAHYTCTYYLFAMLYHILANFLQYIYTDFLQYTKSRQFKQLLVETKAYGEY